MSDETKNESGDDGGAEGQGDPEQLRLIPDGDPLEGLGTTERATEAELFPPSQVPPPHVPESDDERQPETFATGDAPWVGAEEAWRRGSATGLEELKRQSMQRAEDMKAPAQITDEDEEFLIAQAAPLLPTLPPVPYRGMGAGAKAGIIVAVLLVLAAAGGVVYWMNQRFADREKEILALRAAQEDVARLQKQINELLEKGGAENQQRASELQVELDAARQQAAAAVPPPPVDGIGEKPAGGEAPAAEGRRPQAGSPADRKGDTDDNPYGKGPEAQASTAPGTAPAATAGSPAPAAPGAVRGSQDDLLDNALAKPAPAPGPAPGAGATNDLPSGAAGLPEKPSRDQVKSAMDAVTPQVRKCGQGVGRVVVSFTVSGVTGRVQSAEPTGDAVGTPHGLCAARAVKLAKFSPFRQGSLLIKYPFDL